MADMERWRFEKKITFGNLIASCSSIIAILIWVFSLQGRVSTNELMIQQILKADIDIKSAMEKADNETREEIRSMAAQIMNKLDVIDQRQYDLMKDQIKTEKGRQHRGGSNATDGNAASG